MSKVSIVCVYNSEENLNNYLLESLKKQTLLPELILIDNQDNAYSSAAQALNAGAAKANEEFVVFVHQDVVFMHDDDLDKITHCLSKHPNDVLGMAGIIIGKQGVFSNMIHGSEKQPAGSNGIKSLLQVDALDECFIACSKKMYQQIKFDEELCDGWDLYGVDFCYQAKLNNNKVFIMPYSIWHVSPGYPKHAFYDCARRMIGKYQNRMPYLQTCCITKPIPTKWYGRIILYLLELLNYLRGRHYEKS